MYQQQNVSLLALLFSITCLYSQKLPLSCDPEIVIVLDASSSMLQDFSKAKDFVKQLATYTNFDPQHVAVVTFGSLVKVNIGLGTVKKTKGLMKKLSKISLQYGRTAVGDALQTVNQSIVPEMATDCARMVILVEEGLVNAGVPSAPQIDALYARNISVIPVAIGDEIPTAVLRNQSRQGPFYRASNASTLVNIISNVAQSIEYYIRQMETSVHVGDCTNGFRVVANVTKTCASIGVHEKYIAQYIEVCPYSVPCYDPFTNQPYYAGQAWVSNCMAMRCLVTTVQIEASPPSGCDSSDGKCYKPDCGFTFPCTDESGEPYQDCRCVLLNGVPATAITL